MILFLLLWMGVGPPEARAGHGDTHTPLGTVITSGPASVSLTWTSKTTGLLFGDSRTQSTDTAYDTVTFLSFVDVTANLETAFIRPTDSYVFFKHVRNLGNGFDTYRIRGDSLSNYVTGLFHDVNGDSVYSGTDPPASTLVVKAISETVVLVRVQAAATAIDGAVDTLQLSATSQDTFLPSAETVTLVLTVDSQPPTAPGLLTPANALETTSQRPVFTWSASTDTRSGFAYYRFELDTSGVFVNAVLADTGTVTTFTPAANLSAARYYWRVRAVDTVGNVSASNPDSFRLVIDTGTSVSLVSPASGHETNVAAVRFEWSSADAETYTWQLSKSAAFTTITDSAVDTKATFVVRPPPHEDTFYWRVIARDTAGNYDTSAGRGFLLDTSVAQVSLALPADGHETAVLQTVLSWTAIASDSVGIDSYVLEVSRNSSFTSFVFADTVDALRTTDTVTSGLVEDTYFWRVRGIDDLGNAGRNSDSRSLVIDTKVTVTLISPTDGHETTNASIRFVWGSDEAVTYTYQLSRFLTFSSLLDQTVTSGTSTLKTVPAADTYFWRVIGRDSTGNEDTQTRGFLVDNLISAVTVLSPADGHETSNASVVVSWTRITTDSVGIDSYVLEVSKSSTFTGTFTFTDTVDEARSNDTITGLYNDTYFWRVRAIDDVANVSANSTTLGFIVDTSIGQVALALPADLHETSTARPVVTWTAVADSVGIDSYVLEVSKSGTFTGTFTFTDTVDGVLTSDTITGLYNDTYFWRVRAIDDVGNVGLNSSARSILVDTAIDQVTVVSPSDGHETTNASIVVVWTALGVDSTGIDSYVIEASKSSTFTGTFTFTDTVDGSLTSDTLTGLANDTYFWRVRAVDRAGNTGLNSATRGFVHDTLVTKVTLSTPSNGSVTTNFTVPLTWTAVSDSVGVDSYIVEVSTSQTFATFNFADTVDGSKTADTTTTLASTTFYWRVRAIDDLGNVGANADSFSFRIDSALTVALSQPAAGHETNVAAVRFDWSSNLADTYTWQLSKSSTFVTITDSAVDTGAENLIRTIPDQDTFYWRVIAKDTYGNMDTAAARGIVLDTQAATVALSSPADGHETTNASVVVSWSAVSDSVGIDSYAVEVSKSGTFTGTFTFTDTVDGQRTTDTITGLYNDTYFWRVRAIDDLGNVGSNSAARGFILDTSVETVTLVSPAAGHETTNASVVVSWSAVSDSVGIDSYVIEASKSSAFTGTFTFTDTVDGALTSDTITGLYNDTYYWRVRAIDDVGNVGSNSSARGFILDTIVNQVSVTSPADGHETTNASVVVSWSAVSDSVGIDSYVIESSKSGTFTGTFTFTDTVDGLRTSDTITGLYNDTYFWRVRGIDDLGNAGTNSSVRGFIVDTAIDKVTLSSPANNTLTTDSTPTLSWTAVSDSVGIDSYVIEVTSSPAFASLAFVDTVDGTRTSDTTTALAAASYFWRVRAIDDLGNAGANSDSFGFTVDTGVSVALVSPADGHETTSAVVTFVWSSTDAETYTWQLSKSSVFTTVIDSVVDTRVTQVQRTLPDQDTFYWRVIAKDTSGNMDTTTFRIVILDTQVGQVVLTSPISGHETSNVTPVVSWQALADSVGIDSYVIEVSKSITFTGTFTFTDTVAGMRTSDTIIGLYNDTYYWRVRAVDRLKNVGPTSDTRGFIVDTAVGQVTLVTPADLSTTTDTKPVLTWTALTDSVGIDSYAIELSKSTTFSTLVFSDTVSGTRTSDTVTVSLTQDTYYWRVRGLDRLRNVGAHSATFAFRVDSGVNVTLVTPPAGHETTASTLAFVWSTADDAETFTWQLSSGAAFTTITDSVVDTTATSVTKTFAREDTYFWRVIGKDRFGNQDTEVGGFVIDTHAGQVSLLSPADGHDTTNSKPVVSWSALTDSVGIDSYVIEASKSSTFTGSFTFTDTVDGLRTSDTITGLYNDTYFWRVRAIDDLGNIGANSSSRGFLVDTAVAQVTLTAPADGHETSNAKPVVSWSAVTDSVGIDSYVIEASKSNTFTGTITFTDTVDGLRTSDTITGLYNDTYFWRVRAVDHKGNVGVNSAVRGFLIDTEVATVTLVSPVNGFATADSTPSFTWTTKSDSTGIDSHVVQVSKDSGFVNLKFVDTVDGAVTSDTVPAAGFLVEDTYFWRVIAVDNLGNTMASTIYSFVIDTTRPSAPTLGPPANNHETTTLRPAFKWSASSDSGSGIFGYRLELSLDSTFLILSKVDTVLGGAVETAPQADLTPDTYYWRVIAIDVAGNTAVASNAPFRISINSPNASLSFDKTEYKGLRELAQIRLTDPLANLSPVAIDMAEVTVFSDADPSGFTLMLTETEINSNLFVGTIEFTGGLTDAAAKKIRVNPGSGVTARRLQTNGTLVSGSARWLNEATTPLGSVDKARTWPNPANPTLGQPIIFQNLPGDPTMTIEIYTLDMKKVKTLYNGNGITASAFGNSAQWDGKNDGGEFVASGVYLYIVKSQFGTIVKRITLIK